MQTGQRIRDRVTDEDRSLGSGTDQATGHRRVVSEGDTGVGVTVAAVSTDTTPDPPGPWRDVIRPEATAGERRGP